MTVGGEKVKAAGLTASGQAYWFYTPGGPPPHAQALLRFSGIAVAPTPP